MFRFLKCNFKLMIILSALFVGVCSFKTYEHNHEESKKTIRMVSIIFRHGERNPVSSYPTDPNINFTWPGGFNALVPKGALNLLNHGRKLRARYYKLIPANGFYDQSVMKVTSSHYERCLMSGESFLAGFMPPPYSSNILPISWQPIPIVSIPPQNDYYIFQFAPCPVFEAVYNSFSSPDNEFYNETYAKYLDVFDILNKNTGRTFYSIIEIEGIYSTLQIQQSANLKLPEWTKAIYPERMLELVKVSSRLTTKTPWMKKMKGGPLITQILDNMNGKKFKTNNPDRSIFIYSGHDITLKTVMDTIGIMSPTTGEIPNFGATLVFELHDNKLFGDSDFEIRIVYYDDGYVKLPVNIVIPNCEKPCSLGNFTKLMEPYIIRNIEEECQAL